MQNPAFFSKLGISNTIKKGSQTLYNIKWPRLKNSGKSPIKINASQLSKLKFVCKSVLKGGGAEDNREQLKFDSPPHTLMCL